MVRRAVDGRGLWWACEVCVVQLWALFPERIHMPTVVTMSLNELVLCVCMMQLVSFTFSFT
jgi:hypothetical protein